MIWFLLALIVGLVLLLWSAERFIEGAAITANHFGLPSLLIGMVVVGFGTSAPEIVVSVLAAYSGNPGIALGNAYGSNIANIAMVLGATALLSPVVVKSSLLRSELPLLVAVTVFAIYLSLDLELSALDGWGLLLVFALVMGWSIYQGLRGEGDALESDISEELFEHEMPISKALMWLLLGGLLLVVSSRLLVWGAVGIAQVLGVSDLIIGLTIIAIGTSLPELAASLMAVRKNEPDLALGNVLGSNLFNTLAVVGLAGVIHPLALNPEVLYRDMALMTVLTLSLFVLGRGFRRQDGQGRIGSLAGGVLLAVYLAYTAYLVSKVVLA